MSVLFREANEIGFIELDLPDSKVNLLSADMINRFDTILDEIILNKKHLKALVISSMKENIFVAGADIKEIEKIVEADDGAQKAKAGQDLFNKLEDLPFPTIAVIDGMALGGGCELILACDYRLATFNEKVRIGLPEVNLGFVPGFGGTYRLPRLVGLAEGLKMILAGRPIDGNKALKIGLVHRLVPQTGLNHSVDEFVEDVLNGKVKKNPLAGKKKTMMQSFLNDSLIGNWLVFSQSKSSVMKLTKGFYPAPLRAIEVVKKNFYEKRTKGLAIEAQAFGELAITDISKNLVHVFYLSEACKKLSVEGGEDIKPMPIKKGAVLGAGIMGGGIAQLLAAKDIWARLKDINHEANAKGYQAAAKIFKGAVKKRKLSKSQAASKMAHITSTLDYSGFDSVDIVIEAVVEKMEVKQRVFKDLGEVTKPGTILATNTSALSVEEIGRETKDPSRVIGLHFFNPVHRMPLIEIITTPKTSKETIVSTLKLVKKFGKTPILVKDSAGFVVNRILLAYINEAGRIFEECGEMEEIDRVMTDFGMPMGPFTLSDEVGLDVGVKVLRILEESFGELFTPTETFQKVYDKGLLGKKSGKGFYDHTGKERTPNPEIDDIIDELDLSPLDEAECRDRLILLMVNEAARCLEEKVVDDPASIDVGMIFGTGFPPFRGGLLRYADHVGIDHVVSRLNQFAEESESKIYQPCDYILNLQVSGKKFYDL